MITDDVMTTHMQAGNAALRQLLHMPRHPAVPAATAPQLRPPPSQQQVSQLVHAPQIGFRTPLSKSTPCLPSGRLKSAKLSPLNIGIF